MSQDDTLIPLRVLYRADTNISNREKITLYANNFKKYGNFLQEESYFLLEKLRYYEVIFNPDLYQPSLLTVELVPETCWGNNARSNLPKEKWDYLRKQAYKGAKYTCEICRGKGDKHPVECHEIWHYDDENNIQKLTGLISLCPDCHAVKHLGLTKKRGKLYQAKIHLCKVNNWSEQTLDKYLDSVYTVYYKRCKWQWHLDLTWLEDINYDL